MSPLFFSSLSQALLSLRRNSYAFCHRRHAAAGNPGLSFLREEIGELKFLKVAAPSTGRAGNSAEQEEKARFVEISHPWPEWVELMDHLLKSGYLDRDAFQSTSSPCSSSKDLNHIRTACLNFARKNSDLIRYLSRKDIRIVVESGCPSLDRKVVNSGKRLRAYVGTNEGEVCSSCSFRDNCERAYVKASEDERGRTLDVMRILLTYGFDSMSRSVEGPSLSQVVKESIRKLLNDVVDLSIKGYGFVPEDVHEIKKVQNNIPMKQGDWICPICKFLNFAKNIKCLRCAGVFQERLVKLREDREHLPLKKGDWICEKCNFFNFAKNTKCVQCNERATNRMLNPGEWECASCNYINFRKNFYCRKCGWKRPKAECVEYDAAESHTSGRNQNNKPSDSASPHFLKSPGSSRSPQYNFCEGADAIDRDAVQKRRRSAEFHDFPIAGGKSALSSDVRARERWKEEMSSRKKNGLAVQGSSGSSSPSSRFEFIASDECSSDEDDFAGWFGR